MGPPDERRVYWPALDGVRAVAVGLVFAYHTDRAVAPRGGAIGVTTFFALSGFLITTMLLREQSRTGSVALGRFYVRRALRLLPALIALVAVTSAYAAFSGAFPATLDGAVPVLVYMGNWVRTIAGTEGLGLLEHTWSLSVEEQFYIVWPIAVLGAGALVTPRRRPGAVLTVALVGSAVSLVWRLQLWDPNEPRRSAARLYNGTDAVADQLLLGAALAAMLVLWDGRATGSERPMPPLVSWLLGAIAAPGALAYLVFVAAVQPGGVSLDNDRLYLEFGSVSFALAACVVVAAAVRVPDAWLSRMLSIRPLRAVGRLSYGVYLWHYPVILVVDHHLPGERTPARAAAVLAGTAIATLVSWHGVERPFLARKEGFRAPAPGVSPEAQPLSPTT